MRNDQNELETITALSWDTLETLVPTIFKGDKGEREAARRLMRIVRATAMPVHPRRVDGEENARIPEIEEELRRLKSPEADRFLAGLLAMVAAQAAFLWSGAVQLHKGL